MELTRRLSAADGVADDLDLARGLSVFVRGGGDPTSSRQGDQWWFAWHTPAGPVTLWIRRDPAPVVTAWGAGAEWMIERAPALLGARDDPSDFTPHHESVANALPRFARWRIPASGLVAQALVCSVIEQRVTGREAFTSQRRLVRRFGAPAPGPGADRGLVCSPSAADWASIPSWEWLRAGVDASRADVIVRAMRSAGRLDECADLSLEQARARLRTLRGVGEWTMAEISQRALGDADSPSYGDYHVARNVTYALTGEIGDDAAMARLLEPYAGHRYRAQRIVEGSSPPVPRRGPRRTLPGHLPIRW